MTPSFMPCDDRQRDFYSPHFRKALNVECFFDKQDSTLSNYVINYFF